MARPTQFDRIQVLEQAMTVFWQRGYASTSMADLAAAMNLGPGSIYCAFSSKQALLVEAINHYAATRRDWMQDSLNSTASVRSALETLLNQVICATVSPQPAKGCLIINMLLELSSVDETCAELARAHLTQTKALFREALQRARATGEIGVTKEPEDLAIFLIGTLYALHVMSRATDSIAELQVYLKQSLDFIFGADSTVVR
ncbi:MAG: TetR/AcrR family transcriptional repressor of nem operon [Lentimonas sp.]|jgi:TetR/AcrR family transcriptional repressor of nem operon